VPAYADSTSTLESYGRDLALRFNTQNCTAAGAQLLHRFISDSPCIAVLLVPVACAVHPRGTAFIVSVDDPGVVEL